MIKHSSILSAAVVAAIVVLCPSPAHAQQNVSEALRFLVTNVLVDTGSVERDAAAAEATSATISRALLANLATLPITSTSGTFTYRLNPDIGTVERATQTFGSIYVDRALTGGGGTAGIGLTFQHLHFTSLDGRDLRNGSLVTTANRFVDEAEPFDVDQLTLKLDADVATLYGNMGLGNRIDVGAAIPLISLRMDGSRVNTYRGTQFTQATASARAVGLADLLVRGKMTLYDEDTTAVAAAVDVRLPTGRQDDLLGTGSTSVRLSAIGSMEGETNSAHAMLGLALGGLANEVDYGLAFATAASPHVTITAEALGRLIDAPGDIEAVAQPHPTLVGVETMRLLPGGSRLKTLTIAPGIKWNITDTWVLAANVGVPMLKGGLRAPLLPFVGLEYSLTD